MRDLTDATSPTRLKHRFTGYRPFEYFVNDAEGNATLDFVVRSSCHVLWKTSQRTPVVGDGRVKMHSFDPRPESKCRMREAARQVESRLRHRTELVRAGVVTVAEDKAKDHAQTPLRQHLDDYLVSLARSASAYHVRNVRHQLARVTEECGFRRLPDLDASSVERWLAKVRDDGLAARTTNTDLAALKAFGAWCLRDGRLLLSPFTRIARADERSSPRHERRALSEDEVVRVLTAAKLRPLADFGREMLQGSDDGRRRKRSNWRRAPLAFETLEADAAKGRALLAAKAGFLARLEARGRER